MTTFYELLPDNTIGRSTPSAHLAQLLGLSQKTEKEIKYGHNGKRYFVDELPVSPEPSYVEKRLKEYPSIPEQLDMIYWDKVNQTNLWQEKIATIKAKYPKV